MRVAQARECAVVSRRSYQYPYQFHADEVRTHDNLDIPLATKKKLMQTNAERWFRL